MDVGGLVGYHQPEVTFLQYPLAIITYESKVICLKIESDGLGLTWLKLYLVEGTKATTGVILAIKSLLKRSTLSLPATLPVFLTSTDTLMTSP